MASPFFLTVNNQINLFQLSIEKVIVAVIMTLVIIIGEIDLSVASVMGFSACFFGWLFQNGVPAEWAIVFRSSCRGRVGSVQRFLDRMGWHPVAGRDACHHDCLSRLCPRTGRRSRHHRFPRVFDQMGQAAVLGPLPLAMVIFFLLVALFYVVLQRSAFGRQVYFIGSNKDVAAYSGLNVRRIKGDDLYPFGPDCILAGILFAARLGAVRGDVALGFELDIITIVLLGGVSIFGGSGTMVGTLLAILTVLNLRNGMALANTTGHIQTGVLGVLLILSVMVPNIREFIAKSFHPIMRPQDEQEIHDSTWQWRIVRPNWTQGGLGTGGAAHP